MMFDLTQDIGALKVSQLPELLRQAGVLKLKYRAHRDAWEVVYRDVTGGLHSVLAAHQGLHAVLGKLANGVRP